MDYTNPFDADEDLAAAYDAQRAKAAEQGVLYGGLRSGALGLGSSAQSTLAAGARLFGADQFAADRERASDLAQAEAAGAGYRTPSLADIDSLGGAVDWAGGMVSQQLPLLGTMALSGLLGGAAGAALTKKAKLADVVGEAVRKDVRAEALAAQMNLPVAERVAARQGELARQNILEKSKAAAVLREAIGPRSLNAKIGATTGLALPYFATTAGDTYSAIRNDPEAEGTPREQAVGSMLSGAAQTGLGMAFAPVVGMIPSMMRSGASAAALANLPRQVGTKAALKNLGIISAGEAATESAEQLIQQFTQKQFNPNFEYDPAQLLEAGLAGGLVGGVYSAPGALQTALQKPKDATNPAARVQALDATIASADAPLAERASAQAEKSFLMANYGASFQVEPEAMQQQFMQNVDMIEELFAVEPKDKVELVSNYAKFRELEAAQESILESLGDEGQTALLATFDQAQRSEAPPIFETLSDEDKVETLARVIRGTEQLGMSVPEDLRREYDAINTSVIDRNRTAMEQANAEALAMEPDQGLIALMTEEMAQEEAEGFGTQNQSLASVVDTPAEVERAVSTTPGATPQGVERVVSAARGNTASAPRGNTAGGWLSRPTLIKPDAVTVEPTDTNERAVKTIYRRYDVNQDAEKLGGAAGRAPQESLFVRETVKLVPNRNGIGVREVPVQKELLNLSGYDKNLNAAAFMLGNKVLVNRPGEKPTHLSRRLREAALAQNPDPIDIKELFRLANRDVRESRKHLAPREAAQDPEDIGLGYAFENPVEGYKVEFDNSTNTYKLVEEVTGNEMLVPGTIDEILGGRGITYRGEQMQTSGKLRNLISRAYAGNAGRLAYNPDTEAMDVPEARIDIPSMFDLANQSYNFRRMPRPKHSFYVETDADGNVSTLTADTNDEAYLRLNPLIEEYGLTPVKIKGDSFQHGFAAAVDYMAKQGQVLVGKMDNQLFFGTPEERLRFNKERAIEGTGPGSLYDDFNMLERIGVIVKKESGDKRIVDATNVPGRHGEITVNGKKTLTHDGVIGIVRGEPLSQGVSRRRVKRDAAGNWFFQEDKGILRSPLQKLNGKGEVLVTEAESLNSSLQLGKTRDTDDTGVDLGQFNEKDEFEFYPMYPVARQKGGIANLQQILFGAEDPQFLYEKDRKEFLDNLVAEGLLSNDQLLRHAAGIPLRMLIDENAALKWGVNIRAHTSRAYVMSVTSEMLDGNDLDRAIEEFNIPAAFKKEIKKNTKDEFKRIARREYVPGQDDMLLLEGTYNEINKKWKETHKGKDLRPGDIVLLHRDPALPDASSMSAFVYVGKAKLETSRGSHNRGIVVHSSSEGWNEAAGDFDGDSGVLTVPEKGLYPRAKLRSTDPDPKKAEAINKFTYVRKDEVGKKDPINVLIDRYIADNPDAVVHKDGPTVYEWTIQKNADSPPVDLVGELAKQQASGFSQMIGMIMRPAQKLAEMGALETPVKVKTFDANGVYDGGEIEMPVGLLLAKIGQASISAKKKATFSKQALEAFEVAQRLVERLKPQKFINEKGRYVPLNRKDTDFGELSIENSWRKVISALRYSKFKRLPADVQAEVDDAFEALKDYYRNHPNAGVQERFAKAEDTARSKYNELTINGFHKFFIEESKISRGRALWTAPAHLLNDFISIPELHAGGPVNHDYFVSLFAKLDRAPRHGSEAYTKAHQADIDSDIANGLHMENSENLAARQEFGYDPETGRFYGAPRSKREVWDVMVQQAQDVLNTKEAARYPKMFVELAERVMSLNAVYNRIGLFHDAGIPQAFREAAMKKATKSEDDIEVLSSWKDRIQQIGTETATYDSKYDEDLIEDARAESADIMNEIALAYNRGRISGADIIAHGPASQAVKTLINPAELQDIAALVDFNKQHEYYVAAPEAGKAVSGMYELNPETGVMTLQEAFDGSTDGVKVLNPRNTSGRSFFDPNMQGVVNRIVAGAESFGYYTPGRPLVVPVTVTGRETGTEDGKNLVVEVGVSPEAAEMMREWSAVPPLPAKNKLIMKEGPFLSISNSRSGAEVELEVPTHRVGKDGAVADELETITALKNASGKKAIVRITTSKIKNAEAFGTLYTRIKLKDITNEEDPLSARAQLSILLLGRSAAEAAYNADRLTKHLPIAVGGAIAPEASPQQQAQPTTTPAAPTVGTLSGGATAANQAAIKAAELAGGKITTKDPEPALRMALRSALFREIAPNEWQHMSFVSAAPMLRDLGLDNVADAFTPPAVINTIKTLIQAHTSENLPNVANVDRVDFLSAIAAATYNKAEGNSKQEDVEAIVTAGRKLYAHFTNAVRAGTVPRAATTDATPTVTTPEPVSGAELEGMLKDLEDLPGIARVMLFSGIDALKNEVDGGTLHRLLSRPETNEDLVGAYEAVTRALTEVKGKNPVAHIDKFERLISSVDRLTKSYKDSVASAPRGNTAGQTKSETAIKLDTAFGGKESMPIGELYAALVKESADPKLLEDLIAASGIDAARFGALQTILKHAADRKNHKKNANGETPIRGRSYISTSEKSLVELEGVLRNRAGLRYSDAFAASDAALETTDPAEAKRLNDLAGVKQAQYEQLLADADFLAEAIGAVRILGKNRSVKTPSISREKVNELLAKQRNAEEKAVAAIQERQAIELKALLSKLFGVGKKPNIIEVARTVAQSGNGLSNTILDEIAAKYGVEREKLNEYVQISIAEAKARERRKASAGQKKEEKVHMSTDEILHKVLSDSYVPWSIKKLEDTIAGKQEKIDSYDSERVRKNINLEIEFLTKVIARKNAGAYTEPKKISTPADLEALFSKYIQSPEVKRNAALADKELQDFIAKYDAEGAARLENYQKAATDIGRLFGLKNPVKVLDAKNMYMLLKSKGHNTAADSILQFMENPSKGWNGVHIKSDDGTHYMWVSTKLDEAESVGVLSHELGHGIIEEHLQDADKTTRDSINAEFEAYQKQSGEKLDFDEWLADSIRNWLVTEEQPRTAAGVWFKSMAEVFKNALKALRDNILNVLGFKQLLAVPPSVDAWLKSLAKTNAQLDVLYGKDPSNKMSISDRMEQRAARFRLWATNPYASGTAALNEMAQEIGRNLGKYLSPSDVTMLQGLVNTQTVRARLTYMLGKDTEASELIQKNTDMAVGYFYALTTTRVMTAPKEVQSLFSKIREALIHRNRMLIEAGEGDVNEIINKLGARGWQGELSAPTNLIDPSSPAHRLYLERSKQYRDGIFGMLQRGTNAYKQVFSWYIDEPYARLQRTGNPALIDAWKHVQESAYELGGLKRAGMVSRMHANVQIFLREGAVALKGLTEAENNELARYMLTPVDRRGHASEKVRKAATRLDKLYNDAYTYEKDKLGPKVALSSGERTEMNYREGYAPMIPNHDYIEANLESVIDDYSNVAFHTEWAKVKDDYLAWIRRAMGQEGEAAVKEASAEVEEAWDAGLKDFVRFYLKNDGARTLPGQTIERYPTAVAHSPGFRFANPRELGFLLRSTDTNLHSRILNSMNLNPGEVLNMYFRSAVKRMEHERLMANFGENGLKTVFEQAKERGATPQDLRLFANSLLAVQGMLGLTERNYLDSLIEKTDPESSIGSWLHGFHSNKTRIMNEKLSTGLTFAAAWANLSHLTLSLAAAAVDPAGILARSGDFNIFWKSMKETREMLKRIAKEMPPSELDTLLDLSGVMEHANTRNDINATFMAGFDSPSISKVTDVFFRANGVQYLTDFTRAAAGRSAFYTIASWKRMAEDQNLSPEIQQKALRELHSLGLTPEDIDLVKTEDGELPNILTYEKWAQASEAEKERNLRVRAAIHISTDQSTVRPDATSRALVASNPYTAIFMLWKSFATAFGANILKPAWGKMVEEGDASPLMYLALLSIPVMLFSDLLRDAVKMALSDSEDEEGEKRWRPIWKSSWDLSDHLAYAVRRAGFQGSDELALDVISPMLEGKPGEAAAEFGGVIASDARKVAKFGWGNFPMPGDDLTKNWRSSDKTERREADYSAPYYSGI